MIGVKRASARHFASLVFIVFAKASSAHAQAAAAPPPVVQTPSPMTDETRPHERLTQRELKGSTRTFVGPMAKPVEVFVPTDLPKRDEFNLVVHFHGTAWLAEQAVSVADKHAVAAVLNLGTGSGVYDRSFSDPAALDSLLANIAREVSMASGKPKRVGAITLVGFSAGYGAVRAILREPRHFARVSSVLLLDGMHTSYVPEGMTLAAGGVIDSINLIAFRNFALAAVQHEKRFLVTHSEIFPGSYASTTETANWILHSINAHQKPVLKPGPRGMQQLSELHVGHFEVLGFAGNSAPDHIDQLHGMPEFLTRLLKM
ncbi:MAG: hypothetical protein ABJC26_18095 [Gemmatimonadaceae bacterium]